jgi:hypothetical protein
VRAIRLRNNEPIAFATSSQRTTGGLRVTLVNTSAAQFNNLSITTVSYQRLTMWSLLRIVLMSSLLLPLAATSTALASNRSRSRSKYSVRTTLKAVDSDSDGNSDPDSAQMRRRDFFDFTFSDEGETLILPPFSVQLYPIEGNGGVLLDDSRRAIESTMGDYLLDTLTNAFLEESTVDLRSVQVKVVDERVIGTSGERRRLGQRFLRQGTEVALEAILTFSAQPIPDERNIQEDVKVSLSDTNMATFLEEYLALETSAEQLAAVDAAVLVVVPQTTDDDGLPEPPTAAPGERGSISEINQGIPVNVSGDDGGIDAIYPAAIVGVAVFILTVFFFAQRRQRVFDIEDSFVDDDDESKEEHISVDYDGKQQEEEDLRLRSAGPLQTVRMDDGQTTLHIPPINDSSSRVYEPSPMLLSSASSVSSSFTYEDHSYNSPSRGGGAGGGGGGGGYSPYGDGEGEEISRTSSNGFRMS